MTEKIKKDSKFKVFLNNKLVPFFGKISSERHLLGIRNGIMAALPFILVGSVFLIVLNIPISFDGNASKKFLGDIMPDSMKQVFDLINRYTFGVMALYISVGIGAELARLSRISSTQGAVIGLMGYIMWILPLSISINQLDLSTIEGLTQSQIAEIQASAGFLIKNFEGGLWINIKNMGGSTAFVAIVSSTLSIEVYRTCLKNKITIKMPKQVPEAVSNSFAALVPILFISMTIGFIRYFVGFDLATFLQDALSPIGNFLVSNLSGALIVIFLIVFLWWFGIHGSSLVQSVTRPFWLIALEQNQDAWNAGEKIPNAFPEPFFQWFAQYGGSGNTLGLIIVGSIAAKSKQMKTICRTSLVPGIFNINEPILFGLPILLNPFLWIPFVTCPVVGAAVAYSLQVLFGIHWVAMPPWTLPGPIGAFLASGNQWQAIIANLAVLLTSILIWLPFAIGNDRFLLKKELEDSKATII